MSSYMHGHVAAPHRLALRTAAPGMQPGIEDGHVDLLGIEAILSRAFKIACIVCFKGPVSASGTLA